MYCSWFYNSIFWGVLLILEQKINFFVTASYNEPVLSQQVLKALVTESVAISIKEQHSVQSEGFEKTFLIVGGSLEKSKCCLENINDLKLLQIFILHGILFHSVCDIHDGIRKLFLVWSHWSSLKHGFCPHSPPSLYWGDYIWKFNKLLWDKIFSYIYGGINLYEGI